MLSVSFFCLLVQLARFHQCNGATNILVIPDNPSKNIPYILSFYFLSFCFLSFFSLCFSPPTRGKNLLFLFSFINLSQATSSSSMSYSTSYERMQSYSKFLKKKKGNKIFITYLSAYSSSTEQCSGSGMIMSGTESTFQVVPDPDPTL